MNLDKADKTIVVQLVKSSCAVSVVGGYKEYLKFNMRELCAEPDAKPDGGKAAAGAGPEGGAAAVEPAAPAPAAATADQQPQSDGGNETPDAEQTAAPDEAAAHIVQGQTENGRIGPLMVEMRKQ